MNERVTAEGVEFRFVRTNAAPRYGILIRQFDRTIKEIAIRDVRIRANGDTYDKLGADMIFQLERSEISNLESWKEVFVYASVDTWIHDSTFYGDLRGCSVAEAGVTISDDQRIVYEFNHTETPNWAASMAASEQLAIRMINGHLNRGGLNKIYIANNTTKNTYPIFANFDHNKGEIILFHVGGGDM